MWLWYVALVGVWVLCQSGLFNSFNSIGDIMAMFGL